MAVLPFLPSTPSNEERGWKEPNACAAYLRITSSLFVSSAHSGSNARGSLISAYMPIIPSRGVLFKALGLSLALSCPLTFGQQTPLKGSDDSSEEFHERCPFSVERFIVELQQEESWRRMTAAECLGEMKDRRAVESTRRSDLKGKFPSYQYSTPREH